MLGVITARMGSTRLPGKATITLGGRAVLQWVIDSVRRCRHIDDLIIATSENPNNQPILELAKAANVECFQGSEDDVLDRHVQLLRKRKADAFVRFCADNPLADTETTDRLIELFEREKLDYCAVKGLHLPLGLVEVISTRALEVAHAEAPAGLRRESITIYIREHPERFRIRTMGADDLLNTSPYRLTVDYPEDVELWEAMIARLGDPDAITYRRVIELLRDEPELAGLNRHRTQSQGNVYWQQLDANLP